MLKRLLLCLVTSITCYSYFDTSNAMESVSKNDESKQKHETKDGCILCRANPKELFNMKEKSKDYKLDEKNKEENNNYEIKDINNNGFLYGSTSSYGGYNEFLDYHIAEQFFYSTFMKYAKMWRLLDERKYRLLKDGKNICNEKHYKISECYFNYMYNVMFNYWDRWVSRTFKRYGDSRYNFATNSWLDEFYFNEKDARSEVGDILEMLLKYFQLRTEYASEIIDESWIYSYSGYRNKDDSDIRNEDDSNNYLYLLGKDEIHNAIIFDLCGVKLLDNNEINYFCGSKNLYEAFIVSVMRFGLSQYSINKILFENKPIAGFDLENIKSYSGLTLLHKFGLFSLNDIPLIISQLNNASYVVYDDHYYKTEFDYSKCNKNEKDSNLNKVLNSFEFFKLKFNFKLDKDELVLLQAKPESIPEFLHFIFNSASNDLKNNETIDSYVIYYNWCNEVLYTLCRNSEDLKSCELFEYIDQNIQNNKDFLQNLLDVAKFYCSKNVDNEQKFNKNDLLELRKALLNYYQGKLPKEKYMIIDQFNVE